MRNSHVYVVQIHGYLSEKMSDTSKVCVGDRMGTRKPYTVVPYEGVIVNRTESKISTAIGP